MKITRPFLLLKTGAILAAVTVSSSAQLTWLPDADILWDLTSLNWDDDGSAPEVAWDNTGAQEAIFPDAFGAFVDVADGGVTVGDLSTAGLLSLQSVTDNLGLITIKAGGATWNTGGTEIEFVNNQTNDTPLSIATGDTLTIVGAGVFDTGEKPNDAPWIAAGATLDVTEATTVRGNAATIGQFGTVKLAGNSTYVHERNSSQGYFNNWELGAGIVRFGNRFNRFSNLNGIVSGDGTLHVISHNGFFVRLNNAANTFSGGVIVDSSTNRSELQILSADAALGAVPATVDPDNIILREGGELKLVNVPSLESNRGITLDGGVDEDKVGIIVMSGAPCSYGGTITGTGGLQLGRAQGADANGLILTSDTHDYTGNTQIFRGRIGLGIDEALPDDTILTIGGGGSSLFVLNGFTQTLTGLSTAANNIRQVINYDTATSPGIPTETGTVILDIADDPAVDEEFNFGSAFGVTVADDRGNLDVVKNGDGAIGLGTVAITGSVDINAGTLRIGNSLGACIVGDVTNDASLTIDEATTAASFTAGAGSDTTFNWEVSDWTGAAGTGFTQLAVTGDVTLDTTSSLNIVIEEAALANFTESNASFIVATIGGTPTLVPSQITLDSSGFTSGTGTWALNVVGTDVVLDYTAGAASGPYAAWSAGFARLTGGFNDDDDSDGIANGLEYYFFNSDPTVANSSTSPLCVESAAGAGEIVFTHDRPVDDSDITATYEWSTTLDGDWTASGVANGANTVTITPGTPVAAATGYETVTVTTSSVPATLEKVFVRLSVSMP
ncbi:MAG: hypothetical protein ACSHYB_09555 [Roseibacillus sp.]